MATICFATILVHGHWPKKVTQFKFWLVKLNQAVAAISSGQPRPILAVPELLVFFPAKGYPPEKYVRPIPRSKAL